MLTEEQKKQTQNRKLIIKEHRKLIDAIWEFDNLAATMAADQDMPTINRYGKVDKKDLQIIEKRKKQLEELQKKAS